ncbi:MAG: PAS domain S-box protein [Desulfobacteraceae bacterium]|nr:PAS domain S-box protein [Desulfobacteraceae bacterium]
MEEKDMQESYAVEKPAAFAPQISQFPGKTQDLPIPLNQLADFVDYLPDPTFAIDRDGCVIGWNRAIEEMTGVSRTEILGKGEYLYSVPFYGVSRPLIADWAMGAAGGMESRYVSLERKGEVCLGEAFCPKLNGGEGAVVRGTALPLRDHRGNIIGAVESLCDVTVRYRTEEKLKQSELKYRQIFRHTPLGIFHFDSTGVVTDCNDTIIEIWGSSREKFIGFNLLSSLKNKKMKAAVKNCLCGRQAAYEGNYLSVTGGRISNLKAIYGPIVSPGGVIEGGVGLVADISERKREEEVLLESESRLRLLSSKLIDTQEEERRYLARRLQDGLGSSLSAVRFKLQSLLDQTQKNRIEREGLVSTISEIDRALAEAKKIADDLRPPVLDDLGIISTLGWFARKFQSLHPEISLTVAVDAEEMCIPEHLKIVLFRIVQDAFCNIARHSGAHNATLGLSMSEDSLLLRVQDDGRGFEPAPFSDGGLGLNSMKERAELAGGWLDIDSQQGGGTSIRVCFPLAV